MNVRISDAAIASGGAEIEREMIQLAVLRQIETSQSLEFSSYQPEDILCLAKWRGLLPVAGAEDEIPIAELWGNRLKVSVVIASYNYGHYLDEAITSVLMQSYLPDEIILSDDASQDDSAAIMERYADKYPTLIRLNLNPNNLGIQEHFNRVVDMTTGDLVLIVGADNRLPANYVEGQFIALATDPKLGLAYTDFALFGGRAKNDYERMLPEFRGTKLPHGVFLSSFPDLNDASRQLLSDGHNFIHGSTMYRKSLFKEVGGYVDRKEGPEDMSLFQAILATGVGAKKVGSAALEYRQHSSEQANYQFSYFGELQRLREEVSLANKIRQERDAATAEIADLRAELALQIAETHRIVDSKTYRLGRSVAAPFRLLRRTIDKSQKCS